MVKVFALIPRRGDITEQHFHEHWAGPHAELALRITTLRRYVQSHRQPGVIEGLPESPYDGIAEVWFDDAATAAGMGEDPNYAEHAHLDEPNFIDTDRLGFVMTQEHVLHAGPPVAKDAPGVKVMLLLRRADSLSPREFAQRLVSIGEGAVAALEGTTRSTVAVALPESYEDGDGPVFDGVVEIWFAGADEFDRAWRASGEALLAELDSVADPFRSCGLLAEELRVIWPDEAPAGVADASAAGGPSR